MSEQEVWLETDKGININGQHIYCPPDIKATILRDHELAQMAVCKVTGNPIGTDTWAVGGGCDCENCRPYKRLAAAEARIAELEAELGSVRAVRSELKWFDEAKKIAARQVAAEAEAAALRTLVRDLAIKGRTLCDVIMDTWGTNALAALGPMEDALTRAASFLSEKAEAPDHQP